jgi:hypothetical protein
MSGINGHTEEIFSIFGLWECKITLFGKLGLDKNCALLSKGYLCKSFLMGRVWEPFSSDFSKIWHKQNNTYESHA